MVEENKKGIEDRQTKEIILDRLTDIENQIGETIRKLNILEGKIETIEGLDLSKYLKGEMEKDEVVDERITNLLKLAFSLRKLNQYKRDAVFDYLAKKSGIGKSKLIRVVETFENYLEDLI